MSALDLELVKKSVGDDQITSALTTRPGEPTEFDYANLLAERLPPIRTVRSDWFVYGNGTWSKTDRAIFRPKAQLVMPEQLRTARREGAGALEWKRERLNFVWMRIAGLSRLRHDD